MIKSLNKLGYYLIFLRSLKLEGVELHEVPVELLHSLVGRHKHRHVLLQLGQEADLGKG